jgi:hypothetical protein
MCGIWVNLECDGAVRCREWVILVGMWENGWNLVGIWVKMGEMGAIVRNVGEMKMK